MISRRVAAIPALAIIAFFSGSRAEGQATPEPPYTPRAPQAPMPEAPRAPVPRRPAAPPPVATAPVAPNPPTPAPDGWFGFSIRCNECGWSRMRLETTPRWESATTPAIGIVAPGGPADVAGLRTGDLITHIDGVSILTPNGGRLFGAVKPGQRVRLSVTRAGSPVTRELTLGDRPRATSGRSGLRYTGRFRGVDVEVWSPAGATVQRDGDTMVINVGGSTIKLKATTPPPGD